VSIISVKSLGFSYDGSPALFEDISFEIEKGDFIAIAGPNGAGKSTLVKLMVGVLQPNSGTISIAPEYIGRLGYMPQKPSLSINNFPATVEEVVSTGILLKKSFPKGYTRRDKQLVKEAMILLQIENLAGKRIGELSGGQQQRVLLARAFASSPEILILDEPTGALDPQTRGCFYATLKELNEKRGTTILMITHDTHSLDQFAQKLLFIDRCIEYFGDFESFQELSPSHSEHYFHHRDGIGHITLPEATSCK
jgi:zinc transport system ATP-binding protein